MCTTVILFRKNHEWPVIIGSNRDEDFNRPSKFPAKHWGKKFPNIIGGLDLKKKGSWLAIGEEKNIAIIHNRKLVKDNNLIKTSRGLLILELLKIKKINDIIYFLKNINTERYNGFNILFANIDNCLWIKHTSVNKKVEIMEINEGLSILTNEDLNKKNDKKINFFLEKFSRAPIPDPEKDNWLSWELILSMKNIDNQKEINESICFFDKKNNYGTRSSSLIALPNNYGLKNMKNFPIFKTNDDILNSNEYINVELD